MATYNLSTISVHEYRPTVNCTASGSAGEHLNAREDARLRAANGIRDEVVFERMHLMGVEEADYHWLTMRWVRYVQTARAYDGAIAAILGIVPSGINGSAAAPEVG
jgi:hypothetical protein